MAQKFTVGSNSAGLMSGTSSSSSASGSQAAVVQEFSVRVPKPDRPMSVMKFNGALNVDISKWASLKMIREDHLKSSKSEPAPLPSFLADQPDMPKFGAGSEYGREAREEARRRKYGQHKKKVNVEDHPWILKSVTTDKQTKRFKGMREGTISSNASYFIFTQATDGQFEVFPVSNWYNFTPVQTYKALSAEEAEEEFGRRNKILNYFSVMIRKRMKGDEADGGEKEEEGPSGRKKVSGSGLKVSEMEDWDDMNEEMDSDEDEEKDEKEKPKKKKKGGPKKGKKKQKGSDSEANEDSDDGDGEGREVDYISDTSISDSEEDEEGKKVEMGGVDQEGGLRNLLESDTSDEEKQEEKKEKKEEEPEEGGEKAKKKKGTKKKKPATATTANAKSSGDMQAAESLSDESDDDQPDGGNDSDASNKSSALNVEKLPEASAVEGDDSESRKRKAAKAGNGSPNAKKAKLECNPALLQLAASEGITEEAVRRYLLRKPMTATELLQKFKSKKTKVSSDDMVTIIANILKKINPTKRMQNSKMYLFLKN